MAGDALVPPVVSYKPNHKIWYEWIEPEPALPGDPTRRWRARIRVEWVGPNSDRSGLSRDFASVHEVVVRDADDLKRATLETIDYVERHEAREWLLFDGVQYRNPHLEPS